jgi:hypothetical protein
LMALGHEKRVARDEERVDLALVEAREGCVDLTFAGCGLNVDR